MSHNFGRRRAWTSVIFAASVLAVAGAGLYQLAAKRWQVQPTFHVRARFQSIGGLETGGRVRIQGMDAGVIERIVPPSAPGEPVELVLRLDDKLRHLVRPDATAKVVSQGFVGLKAVEIVPGSPVSPAIGELGLIRTETPPDMVELLAAAQSSLKRLDASVAEAEKGIAQVRGLVDAIARGEGSLGKLVRDDELYDNLVALSRRGERTVDELRENLDAVKHTWPISRYYNNRAYYDRDRLLYQPGSSRMSRSFEADEMFEPGRSVLTARGKQQLDEVGRWFQTAARPSSEVVIAAFTETSPNEEKSRILTQARADTVRAYLVEKYSIDSAGWFRGRKVAAVGFGSHTPELVADESASRNLAPSRVDVIVFTPRT